MKRTVEVKRKNEWIRVFGVNDLHNLDEFRMFEPDGRPVIGENGQVVFKAISEPYWSDDLCTWMIDIENRKLR